MSYTNSTIQPSLHERERSPAEIARGRLHVVFNAVNNIFAFLPSETASTSTIEHASETVSRQGNINSTIAGEVKISSEIPNYSQNDPVSSNTTVDQTISYTNLNIDNQNLDKIRGDVQAHAVTSHEVGSMFRDPALEELIKC